LAHLPYAFGPDSFRLFYLCLSCAIFPLLLRLPTNSSFLSAHFRIVKAAATRYFVFGWHLATVRRVSNLGVCNGASCHAASFPLFPTCWSASTARLVPFFSSLQFYPVSFREIRLSRMSLCPCLVLFFALQVACSLRPPTQPLPQGAVPSIPCCELVFFPPDILPPPSKMPGFLPFFEPPSSFYCRHLRV